MLEVAEVQGIVTLALDQGAVGGFISCAVVGVPVAEGGLFANVVPRDAAQAARIAGEIHAAMSLDWSASGKKATRCYQVSIKDKDRNSYAERRFSFAPEETRAEDVLKSAMEAGLTALRGAASVIREPYDLQANHIERQAQIIADMREHEKVLHARIRELETERAGAVDGVLRLLKESSESHVHSAQADAIRAEAGAKIQAYGQITQAATIQLPVLLRIAAKVLGADTSKPPPMIGAAIGLAKEALAATAGTPAPATTTRAAASSPVSASVVSSAGLRLSPEADKALRDLGGSLSSEEIGRLLKWAWDKDPDGTQIFPLLTQPHVEALTAALALALGG